MVQICLWVAVTIPSEGAKWPRRGGVGQDIAIYSGDESDYEITFYTSDGEQSDTFEFDGYFTVKDSRTDEDVAEGTDTLYGIEAVQFDDNFVTFFVNNSFIDLDGDGVATLGIRKVQALQIHS